MLDSALCPGLIGWEDPPQPVPRFLNFSRIAFWFSHIENNAPLPKYQLLPGTFGPDVCNGEVVVLPCPIPQSGDVIKSVYTEP